MNSNEIFRKDVTYDDIKGQKKKGLTFTLEDTLFQKPHGGKIDPPAVLGLSN